jgi:hypothetical protein
MNLSSAGGASLRNKGGALEFGLATFLCGDQMRKTLSFACGKGWATLTSKAEAKADQIQLKGGPPAIILPT